jgi:DNA-binding response OmpR family regulator
MPHKILVIEDHPATAQLISEVLVIEGFMPILAPDGQVGIKKAGEEKPALILLDVMQPELNGLEVCKRLKENPETSGIPVVIISARESEEDKKKGFEAGCADYVVKPFEIKGLVEKIRKHLPFGKVSRP